MVIEENKQYRKIGTVEKLEKYIVKKQPLVAFKNQKKAGYKHRCPNCNCAVGYVEKKPFRKRVLVEHGAPYCCICGQAIEWRKNDNSK